MFAKLARKVAISRTPRSAKLGRVLRRRQSLGSFFLLEDRITPHVALDALGNLVIDVGSGRADDITIAISGTNDYVISDSIPLHHSLGGASGRATKSISVPIALVTGSHIYVRTNDGDDRLTVKFSGGSFSHDVHFDGGAGGYDELQIDGGNFDSVVGNYLNANDGDFVLDPTGSTLARTITYVGLEPVLINAGTAANVVFNLPAAMSNAFLEDDGTVGNGLTRLRSDNSTFELTDFVNPTDSLTINRGHAADALTTAALPDLDCSLTVGTSPAPFTSVTVTGAATLKTDHNFTLFASATIDFSTANSDWVTSGTGAIQLTTASGIRLASASSLATVNGNITLSANQQIPPTSGNFIGIEVNSATIGSTNGDIALMGRGANNNVGILIALGGVVSAGGTGNITVEGRGGSGTSADGISLRNSGSRITSSGGDTVITGVGGIGGFGTAIGVHTESGGAINSGTGKITITGQGTGHASSGVSVGGGISTGGGDIVVSGAGSTGGVGNNFYGGTSIGAISAGGMGMITINGNGGNGGFSFRGTVTTGGGNIGITGIGSVSSGVVVNGTISAGGLGTVTVTGQQVNPTSNLGNMHGVMILNNSRITSNGGNVTVVGNSAGDGSSGAHGVFVDRDGEISAGGLGSVTVEGHGGLSGAGSSGVYLNFNFGEPARITSAGGNVEVTGIGGGTGLNTNNNIGVRVGQECEISAGGTGSIAITGQGGNTSGTGNYGILVTGADSTITSGGGDITLTGTGANSAAAIRIESGAKIVGTIGAPIISLIGDSMNFLSVPSIDASGNTVVLKPRTAATQINLGGAGSPMVLGLPDAELDRITALALVIGDANAAQLNISAAISRSSLTNVELHSGGDTIHNATFSTAGGTLLLDPGPTSAVKPTFSGNDASASALSFASDLSINIAGTTANFPTGYDVLTVNGTVNLAGVNLVLTGNYVPTIGNTFVIVSATNRTGTFANLPTNGSIIAFNGATLAVNYTPMGVTLTATNTSTTVTEVRVGNGVNNVQRSRVTQLVVAFDQVFSYAGLPTAAYTVQRMVGGVPTGSPVSINVNTVIVGTHSEATISFNDNLQFGSLTDGRYRLTVNASQIPGMAGDHVVNFHRMYGDVNADAQVDGPDFSAFSSTFNLFSTHPNYLRFLDVNDDGQVDGFDFSHFSGRFNTFLP